MKSSITGDKTIWNSKLVKIHQKGIFSVEWAHTIKFRGTSKMELLQLDKLDNLLKMRMKILQDSTLKLMKSRKLENLEQF